MTKQTVIVASGLNLGWDCVIAVFDSMASLRRSCITEDMCPIKLDQMEDEDLEKYLREELEIVLHKHTVESYK